MKYSNSSETTGASFTGTNSYDEAIDLLKFGYKDPIPRIKEELANNKLITSKIFRSLPRVMPRNKVIGFAPNVPNALLGLPESMISIEKETHKRKTMSVIYSFGAPWFVDSEELIKAGMALVTAINIAEISGVQTKLQLGFMPATENVDREIVFPTVKIKDFGERFNLQKICFPMIHTSMFRRIGFKYLETCPFCEEDYSGGYGTVRGVIHKLREIEPDKNTYIFEPEQIINDFNYSVEKILKEMDVLK